MKRTLFVVCALMACLCSVAMAMADGPILLVTPAGVYQSDVVGNRPGPWKPVSFDVIVQGFTTGGGPPVVIPPGGGGTSDPFVQKVSEISKSILKDKEEATAVASIVDALAKSGLNGSSLMDALSLSAPLADSSLKADGRIVKWVKDALTVTTDPSKLSAGVRAAFGISSSTTDMIVAQASREEGAAVVEEAIPFAEIIQLIMMIVDLLTKLGIIGG